MEFNLGPRIKENRKRLKITQKEFAKLLGKSERMVQKYESNEVVPSIEVIKQIAAILNMDTYDLLINPDLENELKENTSKSKEDKFIKDFLGYIYFLHEQFFPNEQFNLSNEDITSLMTDINKYSLFLINEIKKDIQLKEKQKAFEEYYSNLKRGE